MNANKKSTIQTNISFSIYFSISDFYSVFEKETYFGPPVGIPLVQNIAVSAARQASVQPWLVGHNTTDSSMNISLWCSGTCEYKGPYKPSQ